MEIIQWFDTEMSRYHAQKALKRAVSAAGMEDQELSNVELYCLRSFSPKERTDLIQEAIVNQNNEKNIALVVIDGIRDLITDINSPDQATDIATRLMKWTENCHLHIITLLHQNKGDNNARGHIGTELVNKAQTVISVEVARDNKDVSNVSAEQTRDQPFEPFSIYFDADGMPCMGEVEKEAATDSRRALTPHDFDLSVHKGICREIFEKEESFGYQELLSMVKVAFGKNGVRIGDNKAKDMITHWTVQGLIVNEKIPGSKKSNYQWKKT